MRNKLAFLSVCILISALSFSQKKAVEIIGNWKGTLSNDKSTRQLIVVITDAYIDDFGKYYGIKGYSTVDEKNKTYFANSDTKDITQCTTIFRLFEPKNGNLRSNGVFELHLYCAGCEGVEDDSESRSENDICGEWKSYDGKLMRYVKLERK
ncbi:MAG: hypothetical protein ACK5D5_09315 [Bacteroidota bacterium]|jgi:hypothetical protein